MKTTNTEIDRKAAEAAKNRVRLASYYRRTGDRIPAKHAHLAHLIGGAK